MSVDASFPALFDPSQGLSYEPSEGKQHKIEVPDLIALIPSGGVYTLLYTIQPHQKTDSPSLGWITLRNPPEGLVQRYKLDPEQLPQHLQLGEKNTHVIVSSKSGACLAEGYFEGVLKPLFEKIGVKFTLHTTTDADSIGEFARSVLGPSANAGEEKLVVLLGGDTAIQELLDAVPPECSKFLLCVLPMGTANALASSLNLYLSTLLHGTPHRLPTFTAKFSLGAKYVTDEARSRKEIKNNTAKGCVVASYGFHASLVGGSDTVAFRKFGRERFGMLAQQLLKGSWGYATPASEEAGRPMHVYNSRITLLPVESPTTTTPKLLQEAEDKHAYLMLPLIPRLEPTFTISPDTSTTLTPISEKATTGEDVNAQVVYIPSVPPPALMEMMQAAYAGGKHVQREDVGYYERRGWRVDMLEKDDQDTVDGDDAGGKGRWRWVCIDGRIVEVEEGGFAEVSLDEPKDNWGLLWRKEEFNNAAGK